MVAHSTATSSAGRRTAHEDRRAGADERDSTAEYSRVRGGVGLLQDLIFCCMQISSREHRTVNDSTVAVLKLASSQRK